MARFVFHAAEVSLTSNVSNKMRGINEEKIYAFSPKFRGESVFE